MIGELSTRQIVALGREGCDVATIAIQMGVEEALVKLVLEQNIIKGDDKAPDRDISDEDLKVLRRHAFNLATQSENEAIQARMTMYLIDRDKPAKQSIQTSPITLINNALIAASESMEKLTKNYTS